MWKRWIVMGLVLVLLVGMLSVCIPGVQAAEGDISVWSMLDTLPMQYCTYNYKNGDATEAASVYFSPAFLLQDSRNLSGELAKASVALSMAAYSRSHVNNLLSSMGFTSYDNSAVYNRSANQLTLYDNDYVAYTIARRTVTDPQTGKDCIIYCVPIQGTPKNEEWYSDFNLGTGTEHEGFRKASLEVYSQLQEYFAGDGFDANRRIVWLTGHSRGAACANLIAGWLSTKNQSYVLPEHVFGYTFACPAVSLEADTSLTNIHNFNNIGDMVPMLPLKEWGYLPYGQTHTMDSSETQLSNVKLQFKTTTGSAYAGEASGTNYKTLLIDIIGTDRNVYHESASLQAVLGIGAWALGGGTIPELAAVINKYMDSPEVLFEVTTGTLKSAWNSLTEEIDEYDGLAVWAYQAYNDTLEMTEEEFQAYLTENAEPVSVLEEESGIEIVDAQSFLTARDALNLENKNIRSAADCIEAAMTLFTDEDGNVLDKILHGHCQATYTVWINSLYYGYSGWAGNSAVTAVDLTDSFVSVGEQCFKGCTSLTSVNIPNRKQVLGNSAFANCTALANLTVPVDHTISASPFSGCTGPVHVSYTRSDTGVFTDRTSGNYTSTMEYSLRGSMQSATFAEGITYIGTYRFKDCTALRTVTLPDTVASIGSYAFYASGITAVDIPDSMTEINSYTFQNCSALATVTIPEGVSNINTYAFNGCKSLTSVTIPESVTNISQYAFEGCTSLPSVVIPGSGVTVNSYAFRNCTALATASVPDSAVLRGYVFDGCSVELTIVCDTGSIPGDYLSTSGNTGYKIPGIREVIVSEGITSIGNYAFYVSDSFNTVLEKVTLPSTLTSLGTYVFYNCDGLTEITIPENVTVIQDNTFYDCDNLADLTLPSGIESIGNQAFTSCDSITAFDIPAGTTSIGNNAFQNCTALTSVTIPENVASIGQYAFEGCTSLPSVVIPGSGVTVNSYAFRNCTALATASVLDSAVLQNQAFSGCSVELTIVCDTGSIPEYYLATNSNNEGYKIPGIREVIVSEGITSIGNYAFSVTEPNQYTNYRSVLEKVTLPSTLTSLGTYVFYNCDGLTEITIPENVTVVQEHTFYDCDNLADLTLPSGIESIGDYAFTSCDSITAFDIPTGTSSIGNYAFQNCSALAMVTIPERVNTIGQYAFGGCISLTSVEIPHSGVTVSNNAFRNCTALATVSVPDSALIYSNVFNGCSVALTVTCDTGSIPEYYLATSSNEGYKIPGIREVIVSEGITSIGNYAFSVNEPNEYTNYRSVLEKVTLPSTLTSLGTSAFYNCDGLTEITIPENVTVIQSYAFAGCENLAEITMPVGSPEILTTIGNDAFYGCTALKSIAVPDGVTTISASTFSCCSSLEQVTLPTTVVKLDNYAFFGCSSLKTIDLPNGVASVGSYVFQNCSALTGFNFPTDLTSLGSYMFTGCTSLTEIAIPQHVTSISNYAFSGCTGLKNVSLYDSTTLQYGIFKDDDVCLTILCHNGAIPSSYMYSGHSSSYCDKMAGVSKLVLEEGITNIGNQAFYNAYGYYDNAIVQVVLPDTIIEIGENAFRGLNSLEQINLPAKITAIPAGMLRECTSLASIDIHDRLMRIDSNAFQGCSALEEVIIPDSVTEMGTYIFAGCTALKDVQLPVAVKTVPNYTFRDCASLESVELPYLVTTVGTGAFQNCDALTEIVWSPKITTVGNDAFRNCDGLVSITFPDMITGMGTYVLSGCTALQEAQLPAGITAIPAGMFDACTALESYQIPDQITSIGNYAFQNCDALQSVLMPEGLSTIGSYVFYDCDALTDVVLPSQVATIGSYVFYDCDILTAIDFPNSVTSLGANSFYSCDLLADVHFGTGLKTIPANAFMDCPSIEEITLPRYLTTVEANAFSVCPSLVKVSIPVSVTNISASAFSYPDRLVLYGIPGSYAESFAVENGFTFVDGTKPALSALLNYSTLTMSRGTSTTLILQVDPDDHTDEITWKSSNTAVATVSDMGVVQAVGIGTAIIKVNVGDVGASCRITVVEPVASVKLNVSQVELKALDTYQLTATVLPEDAYNKTLVWSSSNPEVVEVDENGMITARSKGEATITATTTDGTNLSAKCLVTVTNTAYVITDMDAFESGHNYPNNCSDVWIYTVDRAESLDVTFDSRTEMEEGFDYLRIYTAAGELVGSYTGAELAGKTITVSGNTVKIQIISDDTGTEWGFKVSKVTWPVETVATGWSGSVQWILDSEGVLTIYGEGNMKNYGYNGGQPWLNYKEQIRTIVVEEGVTAVGSGAFMGLTELESITLPETGLTKIGEAAFYGCTSLKEIDIPDTVYTVFDYTFKNCTSLADVSLSKVLIKIGQGAFENCTSLDYIYVPGNTEIIGSWSFKGCTGLIEADMTWADATKIREGAFKNCSALTTIHLPTNIQVLGDSCFYGIGATTFTVPETVTTVEAWCFARAYTLTEIIFEGDAPTIGEGAFNKITLTACYPGENTTWTSDLMQNYGGSVTWKAK